MLHREEGRGDWTQSHAETPDKGGGGTESGSMAHLHFTRSPHESEREFN